MTRRFRKCLRHLIYGTKEKGKKEENKERTLILSPFFFHNTNTQQQQHSTQTANKHTHNIDNQHNIKQYTTNTTNSIQV
jgi:hypothetical protein